MLPLLGTMTKHDPVARKLLPRTYPPQGGKRAWGMLGMRSGSTASRVRRRVRAMRQRAVANGAGRTFRPCRMPKSGRRSRRVGASDARAGIRLCLEFVAPTARLERRGWAEIDWDRAKWTASAKAGREHWLPLSARAAGGVGSGPGRSRTARGLPSEPSKYWSCAARR